MIWWSMREELKLFSFIHKKTEIISLYSRNVYHKDISDESFTHFEFCFVIQNCVLLLLLLIW